MVALKRELARVKKERDFSKETAVDSTGHCNTSLQLIHKIFVIQRFSGTLI